MQTFLASFFPLGLLAVSKGGTVLEYLLQEGDTVPGTTDGILAMGIFIVLVIIIPIVWTRRRWMR